MSGLVAPDGSPLEALYSPSPAKQELPRYKLTLVIEDRPPTEESNGNVKFQWIPEILDDGKWREMTPKDDPVYDTATMKVGAVVMSALKQFEERRRKKGKVALAQRMPKVKDRRPKRRK